jgi:hypothetical protein
MGKGGSVSGKERLQWPKTRRATPAPHPDTGPTVCRRRVRYGGCRASCTAGRPTILAAGLRTCATSLLTRRSWCARGSAWPPTPGHGPRGRPGHGGLDPNPSRVETFLRQVRNLLKSGEFAPVEVRQVLIPRPAANCASWGSRPWLTGWCSPALKAVLEPIFEAGFQPCSYGFRPNRRAHDASAEIQFLTSKPRNYQWVLEVGAGGRHRRVLRRDRSCRAAGAPAGADHRQARLRVG